jgi:trans-aconitate 2-methyltransferase
VQRWPDADVEGVDSSAEMVERAKADGESARLRFTRADLREWQPDRPVDVLTSNATLQWVPGHLDLLPRLLAGVRPGGFFAFQVPGNFGEPSHTAIAAVCDSARWRDRFAGVALDRPGSEEPETYLERLVGLGCRVDAWETTYLQVLQGPDAIARWMTGTALRPALGVLAEEEQAEFLADYRSRVAPHYPEREYGTVLPYRRIFVVAQKGDAA